MTNSELAFPRVVIVGAGFAGLAVAKKLANQALRVTLIDRHNYHLFQPLLYQVATAELTASEIAVPIRHILKKAQNIEVILDAVNDVDTQNQLVTTESGKQLPYDYLVLAAGARHSYFGHDQWERFAPGLKTIEDAHLIKNRILSAFERAEVEADPELRQALLTFVIVGGGPTGVELAGAVAEIARKSMAHEFRHISPELARIILVDAGPRVLAAFDEKLSRKALADLKSLGVEVLTNTPVEGIDELTVRLGDHNIASETVIWAAGVQASPAAQWLGIKAERGNHIPVDDNMNVAGFDNIFAIGDTASFIPAGSDRPLPGVAAVAKQQGHFVGKFIRAKVLGNKPPLFRYRDYGSMATIGRNKAVVWLNGWRITGFPGWLLWSVVHIYYLIGFPNRFLVAFNWFWNYLTSQRSVRLIFGIEKTKS
ncbi:NAD(P)/FAD-dependent oxidoreductase [Methylomarinum vadi]|uniref:NAD(P)/FAD-dependent oxidoreductase n=1 Tax=Methylomarinum vadi TaxID=438855 RepID=UPI0004DFBC50|nr:NAD(P)/FAD-dependent oxidoreductase [Methylomarinum vadi]